MLPSYRLEVIAGGTQAHSLSERGSVVVKLTLPDTVEIDVAGAKKDGVAVLLVGKMKAVPDGGDSVDGLAFPTKTGRRHLYQD